MDNDRKRSGSSLFEQVTTMEIETDADEIRVRQQREKEKSLSVRYDRQIRLWGAEAQKKIQLSNILCVGMSVLNVEVSKNLLLAGFNVTFCDSSHIVGLQDLSGAFFLSEKDIGKRRSDVIRPKLQELNPFAKVT